MMLRFVFGMIVGTIVAVWANWQADRVLRPVVPTLTTEEALHLSVQSWRDRCEVDRLRAENMSLRCGIAKLELDGRLVRPEMPADDLIPPPGVPEK